MQSMRFPWPWEQGEHMVINGETGTGKSTLAKNLLRSRRYLIVVKTKNVVRGVSDEVEYLVEHRTKSLDFLKGQRYNTIEFAPPVDNQIKPLRELYEKVYHQGGWTIYNDEEWYIEEELKIVKPINKLLTQGRTLKLTMVMGCQRPSRISRFVFSQSIHMISFNCEGRDLDVLKEAVSKKYAEAVENLNFQNHEFAWYNKKTRGIWVGTISDLSKNFVL